MLETKIVSYSDLPDEITRECLSDNGDGAEYASYLLIYEDKKLVRCESDAMEKEDARFSRDMFWIKHAIWDAYLFGLTQ